MKYVTVNDAKKAENKGEVLDPESQTEQSGYIDPKRQIEDMILAGRRLDESRKNMYDFPSEEEIDEDAYDPTRSGNFDLSDASQMQYETNERLRDSALKASQKRQEASGEAQKQQDGGNEPPPVKGA